MRVQCRLGCFQLDELEDLTADEKAELRELLRRHRAENAIVQFAQSLPIVGQYLGNVGRFVAYAKGIGTIIVILLILPRAEQAYKYYQPKANWAYEKVCDALDAISRGAIDPDSLQPTQDYIVLTPQPPIITSTSTTSTPGPTTPTLPPRLTIFASTGVSAEVLGGSGIVPPPSTMG